VAAPPSSQPSFLQALLEGDHLRAVYQPLVSIRQNCVVGYEGLIRGSDPFTGTAVGPAELFARAVRDRRVLELDRACRQKVLDSFAAIQKTQPDMILSLNFDASVLDDGVEGSGHLRQVVEDAGLDPSTVMIEIIESNVQGIEALRRFIGAHRDAGFLIALDDVGAGHSNLNRIPLLRPDVLKIDRYLVQNLPADFHKQEVFRSLIQMCHKIGALVVAEGVETREEARAVLEMGVDIIQGYYFALPHAAGHDFGALWKDRIAELGVEQKASILESLRVKRFKLRRYDVLTRDIQVELEKIQRKEFDRRLKELAHFYPLMECLYVLDEGGLQVTDTVFRAPEALRRHGRLFNPPPKGTDHSLRDYYFMLFEAGLGKSTYITEPYISLASGSRCMTFARVFRDGENHRFMLCADIDAQALDRLRADDSGDKPRKNRGVGPEVPEA